MEELGPWELLGLSFALPPVSCPRIMSPPPGQGTPASPALGGECWPPGINPAKSKLTPRPLVELLPQLARGCQPASPVESSEAPRPLSAVASRASHLGGKVAVEATEVGFWAEALPLGFCVRMFLNDHTCSTWKFPGQGAAAAIPDPLTHSARPGIEPTPP